MLRFLNSSNQPAISETDVVSLHQRLSGAERPFLLDVRSAEEFAHDGHIAGAHLLPLPALALRLGELPRDREIVVVCRSGNRSRVAAEQLLRQGFTQVLNLRGGMLAWTHAGLPSRRG